MYAYIQKEHLGHDGHIKVAQAEADTLEVDHIDVGQGDYSEGHLDELYEAVDCGHDKAGGAVGNAAEAQLPEGDLKLQLQVPGAMNINELQEQ